MNDIELYINGQQVDIADNTNILFNYKVKELTNPTIVKNVFTKTVELPMTDNNCKVFGHLWNLTRIQSDVNFNPSKRVDFSLFMNGELIESGYAKLDKITDTFSCTLYGGLGDFFYSLQYNSTTGEKRTLASLDFGRDLSFTIKRQTVMDAWNRLNYGYTGTTDEKWDYINFAPCYNGVPDVIDADKVLINCNGYTGTLRKYDGSEWVNSTGFPGLDSTGSYHLVNGYAMAELPKPLTDLEMRDLRSYLQRPVVSVKKVIEAICNPTNNGGYNVVLDEDFFSDANPYWLYGWMTLDTLNNLGSSQDAYELNLRLYNYTTINGWYNTIYKYNFVDAVPGNASTYKIDFDFNMVGNSSGIADLGNTIYTSAYITDARRTDYSGYAFHIVGYDAAGNKVADGDTVWCTSEVNDDYLKISDTLLTLNGGNVQTQIGYFEKQSASTWKWNQHIELTLEPNNTSISRIGIECYALANVTQEQTNNGGMANSYGQRRGKFYNATTIPTLSGYSGNLTFHSASTIANLEGEYEMSEKSTVLSNTNISQANLLGGSVTPADFLLSFAKLFNLYFVKDTFSKTIYILNQRNYYDGEKVDLDELIDHSKTINITPLSFNTKWYEMKYKDAESTSLADYQKTYGTTYGTQKINTGYEFDAETENLLKNNIFQNAVQVQEISKYYSIRQADGSNEVPTFLYDNVTYKLFNNDYESTDIPLAGPKSAFEGYYNDISTQAIKYDAFPKVQFHSEEGPTDGKNVLLFFNGFVNITSTGPYNPVFWLTDDVQQMMMLNDNKPCWLYTESERNTGNTPIAIAVDSLPAFSRYTTIETRKEILYSWDLGRCKALFVPELSYNSNDSVIYERYWKKYLEDLYDIDTRVVECYVRFDKKVIQDYLKHYYWWDNSYWVINEIVDYNPNSPDTTKVKFIKVNSLDAYTDFDPAEMPQGIVKLTLDTYEIGPEGGVINGYVWVDDEGGWYFDAFDPNIITPNPEQSAGSQHITLTIAPNTGTTQREIFIAIYAEYGDNARIIQLGAASTFNVSPRQLTFTSLGSVNYLNITSNESWSIVAKPIWITASVMSGSSSLTVSLTADDYYESTPRVGNIVVYCQALGVQAVVDVTQVGMGGIEGNTEFLNVSQLGGNVTDYISAEGETVTYNIKSDSPWYITSSKSYVRPQTIYGTGDTVNGETVQVVWDRSDDFGYRDGVLTITSYAGYVVNVTKVQASQSYYSMSLSQNSGVATLSSSERGIVQTQPSWTSISPTSSGYSITYQANTGNTRTGVAVIQQTQPLTLYLQQEGTENNFKVIPSALTYSMSAGFNEGAIVQMFDPEGDEWSVTSFPNWIGSNSNATSGNTTAFVNFIADPNTGAARTGTITVRNITKNENHTIDVSQAGITKSIIFSENPVEFSGDIYSKTITLTFIGRTSETITYTLNTPPGFQEIRLGQFDANNQMTVQLVFDNEPPMFDQYGAITFEGSDGTTADLDVIRYVQ